jgi:hypothetical protein
MELAKNSSRFFGCLHSHKAKDSGAFVTLDIDRDDPDLLKMIIEDVKEIPVWMQTETSRGYHLILNVSNRADAAKFYGQNGLMQKLGLDFCNRIVEIQRDSQEPIPGTLYYRRPDELHYVKILI